MNIGEDYQDFIDSYSVNRHWIVGEGIILENIKDRVTSQPVELEYLEELLDALCTKSIKDAFSKQKDQLSKMPINEWLDRLKNIRVDSFVHDVPSLTTFVDGFKQDRGYDFLDSADLRVKEPEILRILKEITKAPNNLQFAVA